MATCIDTDVCVNGHVNPERRKNRECVPCSLERVREWRKNNTERSRSYAKSPKTKRRTYERHLRDRYGITLDEYEAMYEAQGGVCAICKGINPNGFKLAVDHCHTTSRVRGLLCSNCNAAIGLLNEDHDRFAAAVQYLAIQENGDVYI